MIRALVLAAAVGAPALGAAEPRTLTVTAGPWLGTFHGLTIAGGSARGALQGRPAPLRIAAGTLPLRFEIAFEAGSGRTPNGLVLADTLASMGFVAGEGMLRGTLAMEAGLLWLERATRGELSSIFAMGPRAALSLEVPFERWRGRLLVDLAVRATSEDYVRGAVLVGIAR